MKIFDAPPSRWAGVVPALVFLAAAPPSVSFAEKTAVIVSTSSVDGETISCGCKSKDLGGIARRATVIREVRSTQPVSLVVDAGNFGSETAFEPWMRTTFEWEMMAKQGYDVVTPGPNEMLRGLPALKDLFATAPGIQVVSANVTDKAGTLVWPASTVVEKGGVRFGVTGATDKAYYSFNVTRGKVSSDDFEFGDIAESLRRVLPELRQKSDVVVVLLHTGPGDAQRIVPALEGADVVIVGNNPGHKFVPEKVGDALMVRAGSRGQYVNVLELTVSDANGINGHFGEARPMGEGVVEDAEYKEIVDRFNKEYDDRKEKAGFKEVHHISP